MPDIFDIVSARTGTHKLRYILEDYISGVGEPLSSGTIKWSSHNYVGYQQAIQRTGHSFSPASLTPVEWTTTQGSMTLAISLPYGNDPRFGIMAGFGPVRGGLVVFSVGLEGWLPTEFVPVFFGVISNLQRRGLGNNWALTLRSASSLLLQRSTTTASQLNLFHNFDPPITTTLAANYVAGDVSVTLTSAAALERETGGRYALRIQPNTGDPFIVTGGTLVGNVVGGIGGGALGTTTANASAGNSVEILYHILDHPVDVVRKIGCSTGLGTNGTYDTLPDSWGVAIPEELFDHEDMDGTIAFRNSTGNIRIADTVPVEAPLSWLSGLINPMGFFITEKLGKISVRASNNAFSFVPDLGYIDDSSIIDVQEYSTFSLDQNVEYGRTKYTSGSTVSVSSEEVNTRAAKYTYEADLTSLIDTNISVWHEDINVNAGYWAMRISEGVTLRLMGYENCRLAPGSHVLISSSLVTSRNSSQNDTPWLVLSCDVDWFSGIVTVVAAKVPSYAWV